MKKRVIWKSRVIMKRPIVAVMVGLFFATLAMAEPTATPAPPMVAEIRLDADPRKALEVRAGKEVKVSTSEATKFKVLPGLKDKSYVSLEAVGHTGFYLHHQKFVMYLHQRPKTTNVTFEGDVSFTVVHLEGEKVRFEPSTWRGYFITARGDGSVIIARDPSLEESTFILKQLKAE
jgi:hypothetical protein